MLKPEQSSVENNLFLKKLDSLTEWFLSIWNKLTQFNKILLILGVFSIVPLFLFGDLINYIKSINAVIKGETIDVTKFLTRSTLTIAFFHTLYLLIENKLEKVAEAKKVSNYSTVLKSTFPIVSLTTIPNYLNQEEKVNDSEFIEDQGNQELAKEYKRLADEYPEIIEFPYSKQSIEELFDGTIDGMHKNQIPDKESRVITLLDYLEKPKQQINSMEDLFSI